MITLGLAQMFYFFCLRADFTHGEDSIQAVPRGQLFGFIDLSNTTTMYIFVLAIFLIGFSIIYRVIHSPFGAVLTAIRENETRATSLGYNVDHYKLIAFVLSAALAGTAGGTKAIALQVASLTDVKWPTSGEVVLMTLLGGLGRYSGPVVGAFLVTVLEHYLSESRGWVPVIEGGVFVVCVLTFRQGIMGTLSAALKRPL
jgi:branched-chain amino acid transport system permease protein